MKPRSESLFHFTQTIEVLESIIKNGIYPRYCLEDIGWISAGFRFIAYPMSCFCDIPLSRIKEHTKFYGNYGIGFTKQWGLSVGLNPVCYLPKGGFLKDIASFLATTRSETQEDDTEHVKTWGKLMKITKPLSGEMIVSGKPVEKDFYQESEWRYTPDIDYVIPASSFEKEKDEKNAEAEAYKIKISPNDIRYIIVPSDESIPRLVDFLNSELGEFSHNDIKVLQTRIVTLESLQNDM